MELSYHADPKKPVTGTRGPANKGTDTGKKSGDINEDSKKPKPKPSKK